MIPLSTPRTVKRLKQLCEPLEDGFGLADEILDRGIEEFPRPLRPRWRRIRRALLIVQAEVPPLLTELRPYLINAEDRRTNASRMIA